MRRFQLERTTDVTGVSGTGIVAEGVQFLDGSVVLRWRPPIASTILHSSIANVEKVHCHGGATKVVWLDRCVSCVHLNWPDDKGGQCRGTSCPMWDHDSCQVHEPFTEREQMRDLAREVVAAYPEGE